MTTLFASENLTVRSVSGDTRTSWVVTFDNYGHDRSMDRAGFGEAYFRGQGISAIHVIGKGNDWYQYADMAAAMAAVRAATDGADRVMTYGSSMGGYAAIRFANAVGANAVLALSPQYSIDPAKMPAEDRWIQEGSTIIWREEIDGSIRCDAVPVVCFDPRGLDGVQAARIAADIAITPVVVPYAGHPIGTYLSMVGLLQSIVQDVLYGTVKIAKTRRRALKRRKASEVYLTELARRQPLSRPKTAIALARRALAINPTSELMMHTLARRLTLAGEHAEALHYHVCAVDMSQRYVGYLYPYSEALLASGDQTGALATAREIVAVHPDNAMFNCWLGDVLFAMGSVAEGTVAIERAIHLDPYNSYYRNRLTMYMRDANVPTPVKPLVRGLRALFRKRRHG